MHDPSQNRILVHRIQQAVSRGVAKPIEEELMSLYRVPIESTSYDNRGKPAFGLAETALVIAVLWPLVHKFFEPLVTTAGEAFRNRVLETIRKTRHTPSGPHISVAIQFGDESDEEFPDTPIRYYFYHQIDDEELVKRLKAADKHLKSLPRELFSERSAPVEYGFFWDRETQQWRGCVW